MAGFQLGSEAGDHLIVAINGRPDDCDDWLDARMVVRAGAFSATIDALLLTCDFPPFRSQLESLYRILSGSATFDTIEGQLRFTLTGNDRGGITVAGTISDQSGDGNQLTFHFEIDQTYLPEVIAALRAIETEFASLIHPPFPQ